MSRLPQFLVLCLIMSVVVLCIFAFLEPNGPDVPELPPVESNRVHAEGFSIVCPAEWEASTIRDEAIYLLPRGGSVPKRYGAGMEVYNWGEPPKNLEEFEPTSFQGLPAFEQTETRTGGSFENPPHFISRLAFERDGEWFMLQYHAFLEFKELPEIIWQYLETFRIEARPVKDDADVRG